MFFLYIETLLYWSIIRMRIIYHYNLWTWDDMTWFPAQTFNIKKSVHLIIFLNKKRILIYKLLHHEWYNVCKRGGRRMWKLHFYSSPCTLLSPLPAEPPEVFTLALPLHSRLASLSLLRSSFSQGGTFHIKVNNKYITLGRESLQRRRKTLERFFLTPNNIHFIQHLYKLSDIT